MKTLFSQALPMLFGLWILTACTEAEPLKKPDLSAGKHKLSDSDPRSWETYPAVLLVATKHQLSVGTTAQIIQQFAQRYDADVSGEADMPISWNVFEEDTLPVTNDSEFFSKLGLSIGVPAPVVASIIVDFYTLSGSNRTFPEMH